MTTPRDTNYDDKVLVNEQEHEDDIKDGIEEESDNDGDVIPQYPNIDEPMKKRRRRKKKSTESEPPKPKSRVIFLGKI